ncbi:MAG: hypothetical protein ACREC8_06780 [Limisphaerales bacterium]
MASSKGSGLGIGSRFGLGMIDFALFMYGSQIKEKKSANFSGQPAS